MGSRVTILMRVVISKVPADKGIFESRAEGGLWESHVGIWGICIPGRRKSRYTDSSAGEYMQAEEEGGQSWSQKQGECREVWGFAGHSEHFGFDCY